MGVTATGSVDNRSVADLFAATPLRVPAQTLGQDDFLKLLIAQMTTQDPMNPMTNTDFIAQMAQFTSLEQARTMSATMTQMNQQQQLLQANGLIGREVSLVDDEGTTIHGVVSGVEMQQHTPFIVVAGQHYALSSISSVALPGPVAAPDPKIPTDPVPEPEPQVPVLSETSN